MSRKPVKIPPSRAAVGRKIKNAYKSILRGFYNEDDIFIGYDNKNSIASIYVRNFDIL